MGPFQGLFSLNIFVFYTQLQMIFWTKKFSLWWDSNRGSTFLSLSQIFDNIMITAPLVLLQNFVLCYNCTATLWRRNRDVKAYVSSVLQEALSSSDLGPATAISLAMHGRCGFTARAALVGADGEPSPVQKASLTHKNGSSSYFKSYVHLGLFTFPDPKSF